MPALKAFAFGVTMAIAIGPIALLIVQTAMSRGLRAGAFAGLGAGLADLTYGLVAFFAGHALTPTLEAHAGAIRAAASGVLVAFGLWMVYGALRRPNGAVAAGDPDDGAPSRAPAAGSPLFTTYALTIVNPMTVIAFLGFAPQLPLAGSAWRAAAYAFCLFAGSVCVQLLLALGGAGLGRLVKDRRWIRALNAASGLGIAAFGIAGLV